MAKDTDLAKLEAIAAKMQDYFTLTPPDAPGAVFAGALFSAGPDGSGNRFSAGAADLDQQRARRRCLGEAAETLAQFAQPETLNAASGPQGLTPDEARQLTAMAGAPVDQWLPAWRLDGGKAALPVSLCLRLAHSAAGVARASSLGCAAGATRGKAMLAALSELIERDAAALWWHGGLPAARVQTRLLESAGITALAAELRQGRRGRQLHFLDLTADTGLPVVCAVSCDDDGGRLALGFGAATSIGAACKPALFEMIQMETGNRIVEMKAARNGVESLSAPDRALLERIRRLHMSAPQFDAELGAKQHSELPSGMPPSVAAIAVALSGLGIKVYGTDLAKAPGQIPVVKLVAPDLQPMPMIWQTQRLKVCKKRHGGRLAHFPTLALL